MSEIVVGYDGSDSSKSALKQALEFANGLGDGVVIVFGYARALEAARSRSNGGPSRSSARR